MNRLLLAALLGLLWAGGAAAQSRSRLDDIRTAGIMTCAAEARPGFADSVDDAAPQGVAVQLCRALAIAVLGPQARIRFTLPEADAAFDDLGRGGADVVFLTAASLSLHHLTASFVPGPVVFFDPIAALVPAASSVHAPEDLAGRPICVKIGSPGHAALEARLGQLAPPVMRMTFREDVEMLDTYNVGGCDAAVDEASRLAEMRGLGGVNRLKSRVIAPPLGMTSIIAATPASDGAWSGLVFWVLDALIADRQPPSPWRGELAVAVHGLRPGWRAEVKAALGPDPVTPDDEAWPNAPWPAGLLPPH